ncbi:phosphoethanolamine transferase [Delftia sp. PS-11]|uniref:phosphoethanolamine transferase n=1 Tax=Delftia sp. PS-11 TaxID=2767222 RepID=UPI002458D61B|nr:phosphoethanolamine--lipid A transferase [Delftia sp. PS-11]KAJ8745855.1 phosphoethanolamine--lipid A transferase [Delftia sp. PS-11]
MSERLPFSSASRPSGAGTSSIEASSAGPLAALRRAWSAPRSPQAVVIVLSLWLLLTTNWALWLRLPHLDGYDGSLGVLLLRLLPLGFGGIVALLSFTAWSRGMKPLWIGLLLVAASAQYFMVAYGTVMDSGMVHNILQTDLRESSDLLNPKLLLQLLLVAGLPTAWLLRLRIQRARSLLHAAARMLALLAVAVALVAAAVFVSYRDLAPVVRNNLWMRHMLNPVSPVLSTLNAAFKPLLQPKRPFTSITAGAALGASYAAERKPPLFVIVVGETARAANWGLNGYERDTTPELARRQVLNWRNVTSCGTSTRESVPCMFSHLGRTGFYQAKADYDNLVDVLHAAGLAVLWIDNQAGCKGVCDRIPNASTADRLGTPDGKALCTPDGECLDGMLLSGIDERIAALPAERRERGVVLVMHEMGSHGPAYYKRSTPETKVFQPECLTNALSSCTREQVVNVYDNSIRYNDLFLSKTIDWLAGQQSHYQTGMIYMSDHGESLGEMGIYLHGMPYAMAPDEQKHIPMVAWLGNLAERTGVSERCVRGQLDVPLSHDNLYHTVLGLLDVRSPTYDKPLDALAACRS